MQESDMNTKERKKALSQMQEQASVGLSLEVKV